ncbi:hypothetical protein OPV22_023388 [Ensete ventricosum]|uniref:Uncharacterized protein n=1 Tax=Ensete ventricosum TaxID=4639 RepID=A0AAV8PCQ9_ENSVE|nr:hypothetical protein OPV22_023388 [Ensete ventricosum]
MLRRRGRREPSFAPLGMPFFLVLPRRFVRAERLGPVLLRFPSPPSLRLSSPLALFRTPSLSLSLPPRLQRYWGGVRDGDSDLGSKREAPRSSFPRSIVRREGLANSIVVIWQTDRKGRLLEGN